MGRSFCLSLIIAGLAACLLGAQAATAAPPVVIGVPTSLGTLDGAACLNAAKMAVNEINAKGGVTVAGQKRKLQIAAVDIRDAAPGVPIEEALLGIEKLILEKKPAAVVVGPFRSEVLIPAMDLLAKYKVPLIECIAMTPGFEQKVEANPEKYKCLFRDAFDAVYLVQYLAATMKSLNEQFGFNKVYIMNQDVEWARITAGLVKSTCFDKEGWEVLGLDAYPTGTTDFSSGLMKARAGGAQVIMPIFDMPQGAILVKQWRSMEVPAMMAGVIVPLYGSYAWKTFNGTIAGDINCIFELGSGIASDKIPASVKFFNDYTKTYGKEMQSGHGPAPSYEGVYMLAQAIDRTGSLDPDGIAAQLEKTDRMGIMGRIRFNKGHQVVYGFDPKETAVAAVYQWTANGKRRIIFPKSLAEGKIELPKGLKPAK